MLTFFLIEPFKTKKESVRIKSCLKKALTDKSMVIFSIGIALVMEIFQATTVFLNQVKYIETGLSPAYFGLIVVAIQVLRLLAAKSHSLTKRWGNLFTINSAVILIIISCMFLIITSSSIISILCVATVAGCSAIIGPIEQDIKNKKIDNNERATYLSIYSMLGGIVGAISNLIIGQATKYSIEFGFFVCAIIGCFAIIMLVWFGRSIKIEIDKVIQR